ncbi:MAG: polysaccharide deacetylase family protein [Xanthobacteraceae bacterium]
MESFGRALQRAGFDALYFSGASHLLRPLFGGVGAILALNRISSPWCDPLRPERKMGPQPRFLDALLNYLRRRRIDIITPDELALRLTERKLRRRFVCLTLDGAYRDHYDDAWPIFQKYDAPFALFMPTSFPDQLGELWWMAVAAVVAKSTSVAMLFDGRQQHVTAVTDADKRYLYDGLMRWLLARRDNDEIITFVNDLAGRYGVDIAEMRQRVCMTWQQIGELAVKPLVTIGAQSVTHPILTKLTAKDVEREMQMSRAVIEAAIGIAPKQFAYPFGHAAFAREREFKIARDAGYITAMTLRPGVLRRSHHDAPTALPRISLDGSFQRLRYAKVAMSGVPAAIEARIRARKRD